ncbi:MAG: hypothetical protein ACOYT8_04140 [Candidatus Dependentiae bacterium]
MNTKNKILLTFFCLAFISKASAMFFPFYMPMYIPSTVIIPNTVPDTLSRKWLNWLYAQNSSITSSSDVRSNIDYYHEMIKNHYHYLLYKKQNRDQIKKAKLKRALISTGINASLWAAAVYFFNKGKSTPSYDGQDKYAFLCSASGFMGFFSFIVNCMLVNSYQKYDRILNRNLQRDQHMLLQFEQYKAAINQN